MSKTRQVTSCSKANKLGFPYKPDVLNFTSLGERLISPRIPFMQIDELPRAGQLSIHGNIVNMPSDVNSTVHCLPRPRSESQTIPIKLKRRLGYKHHCQFQNVRPKKVLDAAKYLVDTSELFKTEGIKEQNAWVDGITSRPMKSGVSLFKTLTHPVPMSKQYLTRVLFVASLNCLSRQRERRSPIATEKHEHNTKQRFGKKKNPELLLES